jgi:hypothetical protein
MVIGEQVTETQTWRNQGTPLEIANSIDIWDWSTPTLTIESGS